MDVNSKQTDEEITYNFDFTNRLVSGRTLISCDPIAVTVYKQPTAGGALPADLTVSGVVVESPKAQARIAGGVNRAVYKLTAVGTDSAGDILEIDGLLSIVNY